MNGLLRFDEEAFQAFEGRWPEQVGIFCRQEMGLGETDVPTREHAELLIEQIPDLSLEWDWRRPKPVYCANQKTIYSRHDYRLEDLLHELAHHLRGDGLAAFLRLLARLRRDEKLEALARQCQDLEEARAWAVVEAVFLPARLVMRTSDYDLADLTGWSVEAIQRRRWQIIRAEQSRQGQKAYGTWLAQVLDQQWRDAAG